MTLVKAYVDGASDCEEISENNSEAVRKLLTYGTLCCDGTVVFGSEGEQHIGDPTETSIIVAAYKNGMTKDGLNLSYPRLAEIPFDSDRKLMTTVNRIDGKYVVIVKGAFDMMTARCIDGDMEKAKEMTVAMSKEALRVLAVGYKIIDSVPSAPTSEELEKALEEEGK